MEVGSVPPQLATMYAAQQHSARARTAPAEGSPQPQASAALSPERPENLEEARAQVSTGQGPRIGHFLDTYA